MDYLAAAAASDVLAEVPDEVLSGVREDIRRLLSRPGTPAAPTPRQRAEIEDRLDRLERIAAVLGSETAVRWSRQLTEDYLTAARTARPDGEAAAPSVEPAVSATVVMMLAELEPDIRAARDAAAQARPAPLEGSILAELNAVLDQAGDAAVGAGQDEDAVFRASVDASFQGLQRRIVELAGAQLIPDRAVVASRLVASARMRAASETPAPAVSTIPATLPPGVTWLRAPADTMLQAQAAAAAPSAAGWVTLVAHTDRGVVVDGDARLDEEAIASRLGFPSAQDGADGAPPPVPGGPAGAILLVCDWDAGAFHRLTGKPVLAPVGKTTFMLPTGEVVAGSWSLGADGELVPAENGDWLIWANGQSRPLGTPYLHEAARLLGLELRPGGNPPDQSVSFYYTLTDWQVTALGDLGYSAVSQPLPAAGPADSFYESLITVARPWLRTVLGRNPKPDLIRQRIAAEFAADIGSAHPRYADLVADSSTPAQVLADLRDPTRWDRHSADLVPHVAADAFGLDLRVLGAVGQAPPVGAVSGPRAAGPDGHPYLVVRLADGQFLPALREEGAGPPAWPLAATGAGELSAWGRNLSPEQQRLVGQEAISAPLPAGAPEPADVGRVTEMCYLVDTQVTALAVVRRAIRQVLIGRVRRTVPGQPADPEADEALAEIAEAERFGQRLQQLIDQARFTSRSAELTHEYTEAAARAGRQPQNLANLASAAARVRALAEQVDRRIGDDVPPPGQPGGISEELDPQVQAGDRRRAGGQARLCAAGVRGQRRRGAHAGAGQRRRKRLIGDILQQLSDRIDALADGLIARDLAAESRRPAAGRAAASDRGSAAAAEDNLRQHRDAVQNTAEWQARHRAALDEFERSTPSRELPPGFGVLVNGARRFPLGHQGRLSSINGVPLSEGRQIAELVDGTLRTQDADLADAVRDEIERFIREQGRHAFAQRLLEGGLGVEVLADVDGRRQRFAVMINLHLDMNQVQHVRSLDTEGTPVGEKRHHAVEADHEVIAGSRRKVEAERNLTGTADMMKAFGLGGIASGTLSLTGTSTLSYTAGYDIVSAVKRAPRYEHESAYFDFRGASLRTTVSSMTPAGQARTSRIPLTTVRAAFPIEVAPLKEPDDPPGAFRETPRLVPDSKRFGYTAADLAAAPDQSWWKAAQRIEKVLYHVLSEPEWAGAGLRELRDQVLAILRRGGPVDKEVTEAVEFFLSEPSVLRNYGDMFGPGAISPMIRDSRGNDVGQLVVTARLRTIQPSWIGELGIKEESQRFTNVWDSREQSGAAVLTAGLSAGKGGSQKSC